MELKDFVKETLTQISAGIQESLGSVRETGGYVNPATMAHRKTTDDSHIATLEGGRGVYLVSFDVAVSAEEDKEAKAQAKLEVVSLFSLSGGGGKATKSSATNRISFKVPLSFPVDPVSTEAFAAQEKARHDELRRLGESLNQPTSWS